MKLLVLFVSELAGAPSDALAGATPLAAARTPALDRLAAEGRLGTVRWGARGTDRALLAALGRDPARHDARRGLLEALGMGVALGPDDLALRLDLVSTFRGRLVDVAAGGIGGAEAAGLVGALAEALDGDGVRVHAGEGHRHLLVLEGGRRLDLATVPPSAALGLPVEAVAPRGPDAPRLVALMERARDVLAAHDVNRVRVDLGENPADRAWPWGPGWLTELQPFRLTTGRRLAVTGAVPLARGLAALLDATFAPLDGTLAALDEHDVVLAHVPGEPGLSPRRHLARVERLDRELVGPLASALDARGDARLLLTTDHPNPTIEPSVEVPFLVRGPGIGPGRGARFTETEAARGGARVERGAGLLEFALAHVMEPSS